MYLLWMGPVRDGLTLCMQLGIYGRAFIGSIAGFTWFKEGVKSPCSNVCVGRAEYIVTQIQVSRNQTLHVERNRIHTFVPLVLNIDLCSLR